MPSTRPPTDRPSRRRPRHPNSRVTAAAVLTVALAVAGLAAPAMSPAVESATPPLAAAPAAAAAAARPGLIGVPLAITSQDQLDGYDVAMTRIGTSYVGWISAAAGDAALRTVHLCVVPAGRLTCAGGIQSTASLGPSSAAGLRVLATASGAVSLVWFHDTSPGSVDGPRGGRIARSTVTGAGRLSDAVDIGDTPSFGGLLDAEIGPDQKIWTVGVGSSGLGPLEVRDGTGAVARVRTPWQYVAYASLAFAGRTPVLATTKAGAITTPVAYASRPAASWTAFRGLAGTWSVGTDVGLTATSSGLRLITGVGNADYSPVVARWTGSGFGKATLTGDTNNCAPSSHDTATDASGRLVDVSIECGQIAVANLQDTTRASILRFSARGTTAQGTPQIATTPSGRGIVAWSVENATVGVHLFIAAVRLGDLTTSKTRVIRAGRITVTGPVSCLPAVAVPVAVRGRPAGGWRVAASSLRLNGRMFDPRLLNGAALTPGAPYTLTALVTFANGRSRAAGSVALVFRACGRP